MKINQLKAGVLLSYLAQVIHIASGMIYTPVMLRLLGQSEYGLYQLVSSVIAYLGLLNFGFNGGYLRFYSRYKVNRDEDGIARLNGMFLIIFIVIAALCVLCGSIMIIKANIIFGDGLTEAELGKARILMMILVANLALTFTETVFTVHVAANEQFIFQRVLNVLRTLLNPFLTIPLLIMGFGSVGMVLVSTFINIMVCFLNVTYCKKVLKIQFSFKGLNFGLLREIWIFTFFIFINTIIDEINWHVDKLLLGRMIGTAAVAVHGVAASLNSMYITFSSSIAGVFSPRINRIVAENNDDQELTNLFTRIGRIQFVILWLIISGYIIFGKEFIIIWAGDEYIMSYYIGLFLMVPLTIPLIQNLGIEILRAKNKHKVRSAVYLFIAFVNIFLSIKFISTYGVVGAAVGTAISLILGNCIFMNIYYHKRLGINIIYFWKEIIRFVPAMLIAVVAGIIIKSVFECETLLTLITGILLYCMIYALVQWFVGMNEYEKETFGKPIKKIGAKLCRK